MYVNSHEKTTLGARFFLKSYLLNPKTPPQKIGFRVYKENRHGL